MDGILGDIRLSFVCVFGCDYIGLGVSRFREEGRRRSWGFKFFDELALGYDFG